ncbi:hypothetical protein [Arthrobacter sp.]|uniref:hypothetical protein n=1 Tax=Arthrobacter sp. TaxID=1667 RepID=UPI00339A0E46
MAKGRKINPAMRVAADAAFDKQGNPKPGTATAFMKALDVQRPLVLANLDRLRRKNPDATPAELAATLEKYYLATVSSGGAAVGATAVVPGINAVASLGLSAVATVGFLESTALYAQSIAELHGVDTENPERSQAMVMAILMGEEGRSLIKEFAGQAGGRGGNPARAWGSAVGSTMSSGMVSSLLDSMKKRFLAKLVAKQGTAMLGRVIPFGIGAAVGGVGNHVMGRRVIGATRMAFGEPPLVLPMSLVEDLVENRYRLGELPAAPGRLTAKIMEKLPVVRRKGHKSITESADNDGE